MSLTLKQRQPLNVTHNLEMLYSQPPKISKDKHDELLALCDSDFPVIRLPEHVAFFRSLPH